MGWYILGYILIGIILVVVYLRKGGLPLSDLDSEPVKYLLTFFFCLFWSVPILVLIIVLIGKFIYFLGTGERRG